VTTGEIVTLIVSTAAAAGAGTIAFLRWVVGVWATVRREELAATAASQTAQREDNRRTVDALVQNAEGNAVVASKLDNVVGRLDQMFQPRDEYTPPLGVPLQPRDPGEYGEYGAPRPPSQPRRNIRPGYRSPRPGERDDGGR
jgi:hypothetical protein